MSERPASTYRLQVRPSFDLGAVREVLDYLADLGADWLYLSPLLEAEEGSDHGYDVVDHSTVDPARGGAAALAEVATDARARGMGTLIDIVPNHMGVATPRANAWWWDLLMNGRDSRYAEAFDVDWEAGGGRIRIPVLGDDGLATLTLGEGVLRYHEHEFPIAPGTEGGEPIEQHGRQHYELVHWRRADSELNYRRFFGVNSLAGIRVEVPWVFDESHREILRWVREGLTQGLRVDHPDGLADPKGYFERLRAEAGDVWLLVEKILEGGEELPAEWPVDGTTGYDALGDIDRVLVDPEGRAALDELEARLQGQTVEWAELVHDGKRGNADGILHSEVLRLHRLMPGSDPDAIAEVLACFPVYRSYLPTGREHLEEALAAAKARRPDLAAAIDELAPVLREPSHPAARRFQQTSGAVMAKGVEDTAFYRYSRLTSLAEVGGDPGHFSVTVDEFHARQERRFSTFPHSMTALSTHDTKRGEDVRARIDVIAEIPEEWDAALSRLRRLAPLDDPPFANLLWQAIVGAWPASRERLHAYAEKAAREAGASTTWTEPDADFESAMHALVDAVFGDEAVSAEVSAIAERLTAPGRSNSLSAKLLQLTMPGVPDVYQGSELWEHSLVDPDNRRPVDFGQRRELLARLDEGWRPPVDDSGAAKLLVTSRALRLRRDRPELFEGYAPLEAEGEAAEHLVAFDRGGAIALATRLPLGLERRGGWGETSVDLPDGLVDELTGARYGGRVALGDLLSSYPVALLQSERIER
ncbi:malto-oligosyltrehalose synthase [Salinibacterium sp. SYSU T00001]|uniref:malto-oligosyltrehalose synthase n=1 Tax=Homoserinimonas sedimenticola TaxID=2986805 RepID=UPI00223580AB|nr:malto-oligosyltrehalose synthase [Salinibacterium sedimenticola]MCW4384247.1 malto-oligosyltrehalose synthase [Salinibacterium sedimenticola]